MTTRNLTRLIASAIQRRDEHRQWLEDHGGHLPGYIANYGSKNDEDHYGNGGEAIYAADKAALDKAEQELRTLLDKNQVTGYRAGELLARQVRVEGYARDLVTMAAPLAQAIHDNDFAQIKQLMDAIGDDLRLINGWVVAATA
jgi:hypothetical protein